MCEFHILSVYYSITNYTEFRVLRSSLYTETFNVVREMRFSEFYVFRCKKFLSKLKQIGDTLTWAFPGKILFITLHELHIGKIKVIFLGQNIAATSLHMKTHEPDTFIIDNLVLWYFIDQL